MPISKQFHISQKKKKQRNSYELKEYPNTYIHTVYTIKREQTRDLAATMATSTTIASTTEQRKPSETTAFERRVSIFV